jgi:splicing factor 3B subunit 3
MVNRKETRLTPFQGYDNPLYAALELDYGESDEDPTGEARDATQKFLTFYELDLGLNHVVRKWSEPTDRRANMLVQGGSCIVSQLKSC